MRRNGFTFSGENKITPAGDSLRVLLFLLSGDIIKEIVSGFGLTALVGRYGNGDIGDFEGMDRRK